MTGDARDPLYLIPPPGPLTWLYPELAGLETLGSGDGEAWPEGVLPGRVWDLGRMVPARGGLVDTVLAARPASVQLPDGPRGRTLEFWLGPRLRDAGIPIVLDRSGWSAGQLEAKLAEIAERTPPGTLARVPEPGDRGADRPGSDGWHLLPLPGDPQALIDSVLKVQASFSTRCVIPYFVTRTEPIAPEPGGEVVETRLPLSWWGLLPGDRYPPELRTLYRGLVRRLHPSRYLQFLAYENLALAGIDLWGEVVAGRFRAWPPESPARLSGPAAAHRGDRRHRRGGQVEPGGCGARSARGARSQDGRAQDLPPRRVSRHGDGSDPRAVPEKRTCTSGASSGW